MAILDGKTAVISGAASGIGRATALLFAAEGAAVVALDRAPGVRDTVAAISAAGGRGIAMLGNSARESTVKEVVQIAVAHFGSLDVCFANAGVSGGLMPFLEETGERFQEILAINLLGTFLLMQCAARHMVAQARGVIICTASVAGLRSGAGCMPYSASKAGVISLVQTAANELAGTGVRVNAVCPGLIDTGMTQPIFEQARARGTAAKIGQLNPLKRPGDAEEIARTVLFLASEAASYINGQAIAVDGGLSSTLPTVLRR